MTSKLEFDLAASITHTHSPRAHNDNAQIETMTRVWEFFFTALVSTPSATSHTQRSAKDPIQVINQPTNTSTENPTCNLLAAATSTLVHSNGHSLDPRAQVPESTIWLQSSTTTPIRGLGEPTIGQRTRNTTISSFAQTPSHSSSHGTMPGTARHTLSRLHASGTSALVASLKRFKLSSCNPKPLLSATRMSLVSKCRAPRNVLTYNSRSNLRVFIGRETVTKFVPAPMS
jgi:hypothetical protein